MLKALTIRNLAVIDTLDLEWKPGFTVLTGETGAGKSILIDAIGLAIGTRADLDMVRDGAERAEVSAEFDVSPNSEAANWLRDNAVEDPDQAGSIVIRRVVQTTGRGRAFVNGTPITAAQLRELGESLIEIFGQSESQTLLRSEVQRSLLDNFGEHDAELAAVAAAAAKVRAADAALESLRQAAGGDASQADFLRFQVQELDALGLEADELETLDADQRRLAGAGKILQDGGAASDRLYGDENSIYDQLSSVQHLLEGLLPLSEVFAGPLETVVSVQAQLQDAADTLRAELDRLDLDPQHLERVERRLQAVHDLARKHRIKPEALHEHLTALRAQLDTLEHAAERQEALERERAASFADYRQVADRLSKLRQMSARKFADEVTAIVRTLGMPNAELVCVVEPLDAGAAPAAVRSHGQDSVRLDFSANPGQAPRPLAKVASGGELSRVSLAIQVCSQRGRPAPTMIFDEVDAGISGAVADVVGRQLRALGTGRQVLCVTHLAQVAAQGHQHCGIRKRVSEGQTFTEVAALDARERVDELARMQGGAEISTAARAHARDLLKRANAA